MTAETLDKRAAASPDYYTDALDWEMSRLTQLERSESRAWKVAGVASLAAILSLVAVALLTPLKTTVPFLIYVDKLSGDTKVEVAMEVKKVEGSEVLDKHWLAEYVVGRERYYWNLLQYDYDKTMAFNGDVPRREYGQLFDGPQALHKVMGKANEYAVRIVSITLQGRRPGSTGTGVVRFEKAYHNLEAPQAATTQRYVATVSYAYAPHHFSHERELLLNPLGFTVLAYRVDPELIDSGSAAPTTLTTPPAATTLQLTVPQIKAIPEKARDTAEGHS